MDQKEKDRLTVWILDHKSLFNDSCSLVGSQKIACVLTNLSRGLELRRRWRRVLMRATEGRMEQLLSRKVALLNLDRTTVGIVLAISAVVALTPY